MLLLLATIIDDFYNNNKLNFMILSNIEYDTVYIKILSFKFNNLSVLISQCYEMPIKRTR